MLFDVDGVSASKTEKQDRKDKVISKLKEKFSPDDVSAFRKVLFAEDEVSSRRNVIFSSHDDSHHDDEFTFSSSESPALALFADVYQQYGAADIG